jgi:hypothetical protein
MNKGQTIKTTADLRTPKKERSGSKTALNYHAHKKNNASFSNAHTNLDKSRQTKETMHKNLDVYLK